MTIAETDATLRPAGGPGLEYLRRIQRGLVPPVPAAGLLGLRVVEADPGRVVLELEASGRYGNPRHVHGGILAAVADFGVSAAVLTVVGDGQEVVTADLHVSYLRAVALDAGTLTCTGLVVHVGRTQANATVELAAGGRTLVRASGTCRILGPR